MNAPGFFSPTKTPVAIRWNTVKNRAPAATVVLQSYYHTPASAVLAALPTVLRAGHLRASADYAIERRHSPGHDLLFCVAGAGKVRMGGRDFAVSAGELVWINGYEPHAHWAEPADPWELFWVRVDGPGLEALRGLLGAVREPVFTFAETKEVRAIFRVILRLMRGPSYHREEGACVALARLIAEIRKSRKALRKPGFPEADRDLETVINRMTLYPHRAWTVGELARLGKLSVPGFYRAFRRATGAAPIEWLRRERINLAKRRLSETDDPIKLVADQAGYNSAFFFSRDFKRMAGQSPSEFRRHERNAMHGQFERPLPVENKVG